ncbi:hypothetical protein M8542_03290 [Amycolatopsis sp. OK19-0408]|uniref:PH domain-containing protein n=1 Tax=Amycolatopsis iheyensis TaxID=2945988 RepID=A0A9X2N728_9PSEU|nr:hypothetical protein [Amycolatopsis iheyensis]MCR6481833.1 hypothetical protein [Amycolatopsis iheyensis]
MLDLPTNVLMPGERVLWSGRPRRHPLRFEEWFILGVLGVWTALLCVLFAATLARQNPMVYFLPVLLVFSLLPAAALLLGRQRMARSTTYFVTTLRVLAVHERPWRRVRWDYLALVPVPSLREGREGTGTLSFGWPDPAARVMAVFSRPLPGTPPSDGSLSPRRVEFRGIPDAGQVRELIAEAQGRPLDA